MATINTVYAKENKIDHEIERLNKKCEVYIQKIQEVRETLSGFREGDLDNCMQSVRERLDKEADRQIARIRNSFASQGNVMFLAACVHNVLSALEQHKYAGDTEQIIIKTLECASYQQWQEKKVEGWGKNNKTQL